jgi:hypothetical protein
VPARLVRHLARVFVLPFAAACSEIESLTGSEEKDREAHAVTLTADASTVPPGGTTTVRVKVTRQDGQPLDGAKVQVKAALGTLSPAEFRTHDGGTAAIGYRAGAAPGTERIEAVAGPARGELTLAVQAAPAPPPPPPGPGPAPAPGSSPIDLGSVVWIDTNVSGWPETSRITSVRVGDPPICIDHTKKGQWPTRDGLEGNPWVFVNLGGRWHAATYEWLAAGQVCKGIHRHNIGEHIGRPPLNRWVPRSGEVVGLMVSARARFRADTVRERSNIVMVQWP